MIKTILIALMLLIPCSFCLHGQNNWEVNLKGRMNAKLMPVSEGILVVQEIDTLMEWTCWEFQKFAMNGDLIWDSLLCFPEYVSIGSLKSSPDGSLFCFILGKSNVGRQEYALHVWDANGKEIWMYSFVGKLDAFGAVLDDGTVALTYYQVHTWPPSSELCILSPDGKVLHSKALRYHGSDVKLEAIQTINRSRFLVIVNVPNGQIAAKVNSCTPSMDLVLGLVGRSGHFRSWFVFKNDPWLKYHQGAAFDMNSSSSIYWIRQNVQQDSKERILTCPQYRLEPRNTKMLLHADTIPNMQFEKYLGVRLDKSSTSCKIRIDTVGQIPNCEIISGSNGKAWLLLHENKLLLRNPATNEFNPIAVCKNVDIRTAIVVGNDLYFLGFNRDIGRNELHKREAWLSD